MSEALVPVVEAGLPADLSDFVEPETLVALESAYTRFLGTLNRSDMSPAARTIVTGIAVSKLRESLSEPGVLAILRGLAGTPLGFKMDRTEYPDAVLVNAAAEAILRGLPLVGNCFNIIGEQFYATKEGFEFLVPQRAKYSVSFKVAPISAALRENGGHVEVQASGQYKLHTAPADAPNERLVAVYNVRVNRKNKVAEENVEGKARRKWLRDVWARLSGVELSDGELDDMPANGAAPALKASDFGAPPEPEPPKGAEMSASDQKEFAKALRHKKMEPLAVALFGEPPTWLESTKPKLANLLSSESKLGETFGPPEGWAKHAEEIREMLQ